MATINSLGLEQARANLPLIAARANAGKASVITRHGKPYAAIVPLSVAMANRQGVHFLDLRGSGKGLWGKSVGKELDALRNEWS